MIANSGTLLSSSRFRFVWRVGLCASLALAASVLEFDRWMRAIDRNSVAVQKNQATCNEQCCATSLFVLHLLWAAG